MLIPFAGSLDHCRREQGYYLATFTAFFRNWRIQFSAPPLVFKLRRSVQPDRIGGSRYGHGASPGIHLNTCCGGKFRLRVANDAWS